SSSSLILSSDSSPSLSVSSLALASAPEPLTDSAIMEIDNFPRAIILIYLVIAFSPFGYYLAIHIVAEKEKKLKEFLMIMGLHDTAFWLSWVLLYTSLIFVMSLLMSVIATFSSLFPKSSSFVIFLLFFLYGISSVSVCMCSCSLNFFFFLKPSFWLKRTRNYKELYESSINGTLDFNEIIEPVSSEFQGKEAIRINCVQKTFVKKGETVEALKSLSFDIYEGQITALLGHSGTGKTTLMHILCGLCPPSDGFASIYGYRVSEIDEMLEARRITGVCQQLDIYFDVLTVQENLSIVASIKGIPPNDMIQEVQRVLLDLDMQPIKDNQAKKLSGGQKRKLSIGIAILGDPKVLLLDEPTAGMDPCSRHTVWNLLKNGKANRVTVFSTHFMDEADILADRKAVISQGMLKCLGSSLFLKTKWGIGYRLSMHIDRYCNTEGTASLIRQHIPGASLLKQTEEQLVYALPFNDMDKFSALFADLDTHSHLGVISYGVAMTTLEDVFLKLEVEAEIDQAGEKQTAVLSLQAEEEMDEKSVDELEQSLLLLSETKSCAVSNKSLWKKQVFTMAKVHFLNLKREVKSVAIKVYTQLKISGLYPSAYWCGQALVDIPLFYIILLLMMGSLFVFHHGVYFFPEKFIAVIFCLIGYVPSVVLFNYVVSFTFKTIQNTKEFWSFIFSVVSLMAVLKLPFLLTIIFYKCKSPYLQCVIWLFLLRYLEVKCGGKSLREDPFFSVHQPKESARIDENKESGNKPCLSLRKKRFELNCLLRNQYSFFRKYNTPSCEAQLQVLFLFISGEILGLLGPNGAGKSTLINILVGEVEPTSGQVLMGDYSLGENNEDSSMRFVGYCPQTNPLWPDITLQEHFEIYGAIKGMNESDMNEVIKCVSSALDFKEHLQKRTKKLGAGIKRKLCFALSMLGNPRITLLDEPSTGMDPKAKQHMWKAIRAAFKSKERAAILTTHYMEEAEAVCDRVAILVSGKLRCIGTVQHLKSKFGRGYFLEMKLRHVPLTEKKEYLQREILRIFPNGTYQESFESILAYKIPKEDVHSLALSFSKLEEGEVTIY
uniref:Cholesterol transporter ABCA5 n=1 Tax=Podarcis muralis TaxID=64176 RepID=A0A670I768_PODMU